MAQRIDIVRTGGKLAFQPSPLTVPSGSAVFWQNLDAQASHQIVKAGDTSAVYTDPLASFVEGDPAAISGEYLVSGTVNYTCKDDTSVTRVISLTTTT
jgi:plastocyanin